MNTHPTSPSSTGDSQPSGFTPIQSTLLAATVLVAAVPVVLLTAMQRLAPDGLFLEIACIVLSLALAVAVSCVLTRRWAAQAGSIRSAVDSLAAGELAARAETLTNDELGAIAAALNRWRDAASEASSAVLDPAALQQPLQTLVSAARQLSGTSTELDASTQKLSHESDFYTSQVNDTSAAVSEIVESIRQVAETTSASTAVAGEARETATVGLRAVANTKQGMQRIRDQVQSTSKIIKQLGESTQQIGEIVKLISDIADRTSLLALNASIQAAMAGEAGEGFGVVAEEVEHLSKRCNDATKQMSKLVRSFQSGAAEAIAGMEESISEVVEGSKLASQAGDALADIDAVSIRLAELIDSISNAAKQQARGGLLASRSMNEISAVMHENAVGTKQTAQSVRQIVALASGLSTSVQQVRAVVEPDAAGNASDASPAWPDSIADAAAAAAPVNQIAPLPVPELVPNASSTVGVG